jgi:hypothetical protein
MTLARKRRGMRAMWWCRAMTCVIWLEGGGGRLALGSDEDDSRASIINSVQCNGREVLELGWLGGITDVTQLGHSKEKIGRRRH